MNYRRANNILLTLIIVVNAYVIIAPLLPSITFWWQDRGGSQRAVLIQKVQNGSLKSEPNQLIIPSMLLDEKIVEGPKSKTILNLRKGVWRWPEGSTPDKGGNTSFIGHRFTYYNPRGVFYYLDKVKIGQPIGVIWNHKRYQYRVTNIKEVQPTEISVLNQTKDSRITIVTCTPIWLPKHRLVVTAQLVTRTGTTP